MKKLSLIPLLLVWLVNGGLQGQNLVLNPSFENFSACPLGPSEFDNATNWQSPFINLLGDTCSTSDLYNTCSPFGGFGVGVPANILGNQAARTGNGYAGIIVTERLALLGCTSFFGTGWREYVEGTLSAPLTAGQQYCVTFYVSLADNAKYGSDNMGVHFSNSLVNVNCATVGGSSALGSLGFVPQLTWTGGFVNDAVGWTQMQWAYTANGGENFITIGNFNADGATNFSCANGSAFNPYAYYYIDDVSVVPGPCSVLPVELGEWSGEQQEDESVLLSWVPLGENERTFVVESSSDGASFREIGRRNGNGDSKARIEFSDSEAHSPLSFYRLQELDEEGNTAYSEVIAVPTVFKPQMKVGEIFPNPADHHFSFEFISPGRLATDLYAQLYNAQGHLVYSRLFPNTEGNAILEVETENLPDGLYSLVLTSNGQKAARKVLVVHPR